MELNLERVANGYKAPIVFNAATNIF